MLNRGWQWATSQLPALLLLLVNIVGLVSSYTCKSPSGSEVDWFFAYKLPSLNSRDQRFSSGTAFLYADSRTGTWILSNASVADKTSAIGLTAGQIFQAKRDKSSFFALYNDENPNSGKTDSGRAHMKGVVVSDDISGFWLVHSVPKFPASNGGGGYAYPESGRRNGQSFLCITFASDQLLEIGDQLFVAQPSFYDAQMPPSFERLYPGLANAVNKKTYPKGKPPASIKSFHSRGPISQSFLSFSKHKRFDKDLYEDLVAPELRTSLYTETWMVGRSDLGSNCSTNFQVHNVQSMRFPQSPDVAFKNTEDHSKWAVSQQRGGGGRDDSSWICIGDINRQQSQWKRGGGTVCMANARMAELYRPAIEGVECCRGESQCSPRR